MQCDRNIHHRRSIRLKEYDYSQNGAYFITICVQNKECLFGKIANGKMQLNDAGNIIQTIWDEIPEYYDGIETDTFQIMPNHIHGIIIIVGAGPCACPIKSGQPRGVAPTKLSLFDVVHRFKTMTTKQYIDGVKFKNWQPFDHKLWQRNYFEHVIRNEQSLNKIREYILNNPYGWEKDELFVKNL